MMLYLGPSTQPQAPTWNSKQTLKKTVPDFTSISGPNVQLRELPEKTPIAVFQDISLLHCNPRLIALFRSLVAQCSRSWNTHRIKAVTAIFTKFFLRTPLGLQLLFV
ncbi:hypothetical protein AVEN_263731-1 [Araneus ventricosus]|uniref:Uncharacterized protein n=1 Tax=Araneus ventricosus TaxID=182803 RepID=A0A4Y2ASH2_ARAVE|nr:hypothetical protein AVEN_263731-1 [Araneus ventricosus]